MPAPFAVCNTAIRHRFGDTVAVDGVDDRLYPARGGPGREVVGADPSLEW
ncbi:MAG TPA: hypothetical protein VFW64_19215 [Pseudonocardiaceae bacterium]|nr:hypothetical protein [Pseudonocardiaceae bacterium]